MTYPNPLFNSEPPKPNGFKAKAYEAFMADNFTIIDKEKKEVPLKANAPQHSLNQFMEVYLNILILKARKMGFSSDALGIAATKFITGRNEKCVSMSFDQSASDKQLGRAKHYIRSYERLTGKVVPLKYNSKTELVWEGKDEDGSTFVNTLRVASAGNSSFGRGDDITFLHLTEVSLSDVPTLLAGVGEACLPMAHKILETTANGFNSYKEFWDKTVLNETSFAALFYSPLWEYSQDFINDKKKALGRLVDQEYPMTPEEAFIASGESFFDKEAMAQYLEDVKYTKPLTELILA